MLSDQTTTINLRPTGFEIVHDRCGHREYVSFKSLRERGRINCPRDGVLLTDFERIARALCDSLYGVVAGSDPRLTPAVKQSAMSQVVAQLEHLVG